jgi:hypothetical protein
MIIGMSTEKGRALTREQINRRKKTNRGQNVPKIVYGTQATAKKVGSWQIWIFSDADLSMLQELPPYSSVRTHKAVRQCIKM